MGRPKSPKASPPGGLHASPHRKLSDPMHKDSSHDAGASPGDTLPLWMIQLITGAVAGLVYLNSLHGDFVHDDLPAVVHNPDVRGSRGWAAAWTRDFWGGDVTANTSHKSYRPLTVLSFRLNHVVSGLSPFPYHVTNVLLHVLATCLFCRLCRRVVFPARHQGRCALLAAMLFAVHPVHTEAVTSVVGRADVLAGVLFLITINLYTHFLENSSNTRNFLLVPVLAGLAMLAKETGITVLGVCALYDVCQHHNLIFMYFSFHRPMRSSQKFHQLVYRLIIIFTSTSMLLYARAAVMGFSPPRFTEQDNPAAFAADCLARWLTHTHVYAHNVRLLLFPARLSYDWQMHAVGPLVTAVRDARNLATAGTAGGLLGLAVFACKRGHRALLWGLALLIIPFLPASNIFFTVGFVIAERILYIPSMGAVILVSASVHHVATSCPFPRRQGSLPTVYTLASLLCMLYAARTVMRNPVWASREALFRSGLESVPHNAKVHYNFANLMKDSGETQEAIKYYNNTLRLWPSHASAHNNLGTLLGADDPAMAEHHYRAAISINPQHANAHFNLGNLLHQQGHSESGLVCLEQAVKLDPDCVTCLVNAAAVHTSLGDSRAAEEKYRLALTISPTDTHTLNNYAVFLENSERPSAALVLLERVLRQDGTHTTALQNAARIHSALGHIKKAEVLYDRLLSVQPMSGDVLNAAGAFHFNAGHVVRAAQFFSQASSIEPLNWRFTKNHVQALNALRRFRDAKGSLEEFLLRHPNHIEAIQERANVLGEIGQHEQAIEQLQEAISLTEHPADTLADIHVALGRHYRDLQHMDEALHSYQWAVTVKPTLAEAQHSLAVIYHIKGNLTQAQHHYQEAAQLQPDNPLLQQNISKLRRSLMQAYPGTT